MIGTGKPWVYREGERVREWERYIEKTFIVTHINNEEILSKRADLKPNSPAPDFAASPRLTSSNAPTKLRAKGDKDAANPGKSLRGVSWTEVFGFLRKGALDYAKSFAQSCSGRYTLCREGCSRCLGWAIDALGIYTVHT